MIAPSTLGTIGRALLMEAVCQALTDDWQGTRGIQKKVFGDRPTDDDDLDEQYRRLVLLSLRYAEDCGRLESRGERHDRGRGAWRLPQ